MKHTEHFQKTSASDDDGDDLDGRLLVFELGRIQAMWDRSNLTQPSFSLTGHVRLDLSLIADIIPCDFRDHSSHLNVSRNK